MSNQIICQCGKAFNTQNGFNAHKTYCSAYVSTLTLEEQERICKIQQERLRRKEQRMSNAKQKITKCNFCQWFQVAIIFEDMKKK